MTWNEFAAIIFILYHVMILTVVFWQSYRIDVLEKEFKTHLNSLREAILDLMSARSAYYHSEEEDDSHDSDLD